MKALIAHIQPCESGVRVAQVCQDNEVFAVADGLEWVTCPDNIVADVYWFDTNTREFKLNPYYIVEEPQAQPTTDGAQQL